MANTAAFAFNPRFRAWNAAGTAALAGGKVDVYLAQTTTRSPSYPTYVDAQNATNANANPVVLDANGEANIVLPTLAGGGLYKLVLSDASSVVQWTEDNYSTPVGFSTANLAEWAIETYPVAYVSATSFKVTGVDRSAIYHVGRRVLVSNNPGTTYGTVTAVAFVTDTTVTVDCDAATTIASTMSQISYGLLSYANPSYLDPRTAFCAVKNGDMTGFGSSTKVITWTVEKDNLSEWVAGSHRWVAKYPGNYLIIFQTQLSDTSASQSITTTIAKNGAGIASSVNRSAATGGQFTSPVTQHLLNLVATDYIEMFLTGTANTTITGSVASVFTVLRIS